MSRSDARVPTPIQGGCQVVPLGASSASTAAPVGGPGGRKVLLAAVGGDAHYAFGNPGPTATTADTYLPADSEHLVRIPPNSFVSAIQGGAAGGTLYVSDMGD